MDWSEQSITNFAKQSNSFWIVATLGAALPIIVLAIMGDVFWIGAMVAILMCLIMLVTCCLAREIVRLRHRIDKLEAQIHQ